MERRKILLGSGAVFATVLAGCSSSETDEEKSDDKNGDDKSDNEFDDKNGDDKNGDDKNGDDKNGDDKDGKGDHDGHDKIPGFKKGKLTVDSDLISIKRVERDKRTVTVVVNTRTKDAEKLRGEVESLLDCHADALKDAKKFKSEIDRIYWEIEYKKKPMASFYVEVDWLVKYYKGQLSEKKLIKKIEKTQ